MTHSEKLQLAREVEEFLITLLGPIEDSELEEAAEVIRQTVNDFLDSEV